MEADCGYFQGLYEAAGGTEKVIHDRCSYQTIARKEYAVLRGRSGILAVWLVRHGRYRTTYKRMKRWPAEIDPDFDLDAHEELLARLGLI